MESINTQLYKLYEPVWNNLTEHCSKLEIENYELSLAHPLFIRVDDKYEKAKFKVMIVGQETDGWIDDFSSIKTRKSLDFILNDYYSYLYNTVDKMCKEFYVDYTPSQRLKKKGQRPFWNQANFKFFQNEINEGLKKDFGDDCISFIWNNVSKLGKTSRGKATKDLENIEDKILKGLHKKELEILKPDVIIFTSGSSRDYLISKRFGGDFSRPTIFTEKEIAKITFSSPYSNILALRTFHPNARAHVKTRKSRNIAIVKEVVTYLKQL